MATITDRSYDLLSENERILLRRLAVFTGGCTLKAVEKVCSDDRILVGDVLDLLTHLVDKSLLAVDEQPSYLRYRILETVQQNAREKLLESGEGEQIRKQHLNYFLELALEAESKLKGPGYVEWMKRLDEENPNILAAMDWSLEVSLEEGQELIGALWWFWSDRGYCREGYEWSQRALAKNDDVGTPVRIRLLTEAGWYAYLLALYDEAKGYCNESITISRQLGVPESVAWPLATLGLISLFSNSNFTQAESLCQESLELFKRSQDMFGIRNVLTYLGWVAQNQGNYVRAETLFQESLNVSREAGHVQGMAWALQVLGWLAVEQRHYPLALSLYEESQSLLRGAKTVMEEWLLGDKATAYIQIGDYDQAKKCIEEILPLHRKRGDISGELFSLRRLGHIAMREGDYARARSLFNQSAKLLHQIKDGLEIAITLIYIGRLTLAQGFPEPFVRLLGIGEGLVPDLWQKVFSYFKTETEQAIESARATLGEEVYNAAYAEGRAMDMEQAVAYALEALKE